MTCSLSNSAFVRTSRYETFFSSTSGPASFAEVDGTSGIPAIVYRILPLRRQSSDGQHSTSNAELCEQSICMLTHAGTCASLLSHQGFETWNLGRRKWIAFGQLKRQCLFSFSASCERHTEQHQSEATFSIGGQIVRIEPIIERNNGSSPLQWEKGFTELW